MIRTPQELTESIQKAVNRRAVVFSHVVLALTITIHTVLATDVNTFTLAVAVIMSVGVIAMIFLRVFDLARVNSHPRSYLIAYYLLIFAGYTFVSDPATPYTAGVFLVVFLTNIYYGSQGVLFTIGFFGFMSVAKYIYLDNTLVLTYADRLNIIVAFFVFVATCSIFINIQKVFDWDRQRLRDSIKEAILEEKRLRALINNMTESVLVLDKAGIVRLYNAAALALFDTNSTLEGKILGEFMPLEDEKARKLSILDLLPSGTQPIARNDILIRYGESDTAALSMIVTPLSTSFGEDEEETGYIVTMRDITREKSLEEERNEFISVISHELRTPVTVTEASISNAMLINERNENNEKVAKSLKIAHDQSIYLANMLNDLSTFARAEKGTLELNLEDISPQELIERLENDYRNEVEVKGMSIKSRVDDSVPKSIVSNRLYIREILQNFVTNAIKYSDSGTVTISASAADGGVKFSIMDEGIGISTSDQKKVFDKFFRSEDFRTRSSNGTGLGLYIVKKLAKLIQAMFELSSEVGKGSTFSIIVPDLTELKAQQHHPSGTVNNTSYTTEEKTEEEIPTPSAPAEVPVAPTEDLPKQG